MLIGFSVGNFRSFKDVVTLNMVATEAAEGNEELDNNNVFPINQNLNLLKSAAIYGANASGKSNLILALDFMRDFVIDSARLQVTDKIDVENFRLSVQTVNTPSFFEIIFQLEGKTYRYGFEVTQERVVSEWLYCTPKTREANLFIRDENKINIKSTARIEQGNRLKSLTKKNTLFLSVAAQFNDQLAGKIVFWLSQLGIISGLDIDSLHRLTVDYFAEDKIFSNAVIELIKKLDLSIHDLEIETRKISIDSLPSEFPDSLRNVMNNFTGEVRAVRVKTYHQKYDSQGNVIGLENFDMDINESDGTQKLFALSAPILDTLQKGEVLVIDELDARLHPLITRKIIGLFNSNKTNSKNAQLIFSTHDVNLLSNEFFRRDQIWFTEKTHQGATDLYSLVEFDIDNDTSFEKDYITGRYGAIPFIGDIDRMIGGQHE
jgi:uncharacterized protein